MKKWGDIFIWILAIICAFFLVVCAPPVAAGFIGVPFAKFSDNPYVGIVIGFLVSVAAMFLIANFAEAAVLLCTFQCRKVIIHYILRVENEMHPAVQE